jgi:hypothetical protein
VAVDPTATTTARGEVTMVEPSKGNPPVTSDSIVNLDQ